MTVDYYNQNAAAFDADTQSVDMERLYEEFLPHVPAGGLIIDAGCGTGRDTKAFQQRGFEVLAFDASEALVNIARDRVGYDSVMHATFLEFTSFDPADAIWACASLLHVPFNEVTKTFKHLQQQLKHDGIVYCSFKYGDTEVERNGRRFTNLNEVMLEQILASTELRIKKTWVTGDARPGRESEQWLNAILVRSSA